MTMSKKVYCIDRYNYQNIKSHKNYSGYEQILKYHSSFKIIRGNRTLSKLCQIIFKINKPKDYQAKTIGEEILALVKALITGRPVFYLYADKDAFILPRFKRKFKIKRLRLFGTLHWPQEISADFSFYKYQLENHFDGIITLSSLLGQQRSCRHAIIPHGIDINYWQNNHSENRNNTYIVIGMSNRNHKKQSEVLVRIEQKDENAEFLIFLGDKKIRKYYAGIKNLKFIDSVITDDALKEVYSNCKAVVLIQDYCLASNVVLEALSMGAPLIVNKIGDIAEYIGEDYLLYVDLKEQKDNIDYFISSPEFRKEISDKLLMRRKKFKWSEIADKVYQFIFENE